MDLFEKELSELEGSVPSGQADSESTTSCDPSVNVPFWSTAISECRKSRRRFSSLVVALIIAVLISADAYILTTAYFGKGWLRNAFSKDSGNVSFTLPIYDTPELEDSKYLPDGRYTTEGLAEALTPSVVAIVVSYDFSPATLMAGTAQGSGIIISEDGYIVTNAHVVEDQPLSVKVVLNDDKEYSARIIGLDAKTDIAVIKVDAEGLKPAQFADSDNVRPGEEVAAIGNPAGLHGSITKGIVSAVGRGVRTSAEMLEMECIQIDAAINPGNSGGALFNMWGQVVGVISSKLSASQFDGIGFAITTNAAKPIIEELIAEGSIKSRVRIGISFYGISSESAQMYGYAASGLYIDSIDGSCDISNTELQTGDVITEMNGMAVTSINEVKEAIEGLKPGDEVTAKVSRLSEDKKEVLSTFEITFKLESDTSDTDGFIRE